MAMFLAHVAFILETFSVGLGLIALHHGGANKKLYSLAGWIMLLIGIGGWVCTLYYMYSYYFMGDFQHAYPHMMLQNK